MNILRYISIFGLALLAFTACDDKLDLLPAQSIAGEVALSTEDNIENVLIGAYAEAGKDESYGGQLQFMADLLGSGGYITWVGTFIEPRQVFNKEMLADNTFVTLFWNNHYATINQANLVIDNLAIVTSSDDKRNRIEGEAKFLRALSYFDLVRHFASDDIGVPLRTSGISDYAVDLSIVRASTNEVYALVLSDLNDAITLLPETNEFFADRFSAEALLARVQLQLGNYSAALQAADNVIQNSGASLTGTFAEAFNNDMNSSEDIFAFQVTSQDGQNDLINHYADEGNGGRGGDIIITDAYVALFDTNDVRGKFFYPSGQSEERLTGKYTNQFGNIPLIRLAEIYLIRAETNLRLDSEVGATPANDIARIRTRSNADALSDDEIDLDAVFNERILELAFEGFFVHDYRRTGRSVDGFASDADELVMPIPQSELDTNPLITPNP